MLIITGWQCTLLTAKPACYASQLIMLASVSDDQMMVVTDSR